MKKIICALIFSFFLFIPFAFAETTIKAEVDQASITTDDLLTYKVIILSSEKRLPDLQLPEFTGFKVVSSAQSNTLSFVKGDLRTVFVYVVMLLPDAPGKIKIPASFIEMDKQVLSTDAFEIEVKPGKKKPKPQPKIKPPLPKEPQPGKKEPQVTL